MAMWRRNLAWQRRSRRPALVRTLDFGLAQNAFFDEMIDNMHREQEISTKEEERQSQSQSLAQARPVPSREPISATRPGGFLWPNTGRISVSPGILLGRSGVHPTFALATTSPAAMIRATVVAVAPSGPGRPIAVVNSGQERVLVEVGTTPTIGADAWLSATTPGAVTPTGPSGMYTQMVGEFQSAVAPDGTAWVALQIERRPSRYV